MTTDYRGRTDVSPKPSLADRQHALESAFKLFNQLSEELTGSYQQLQTQVLELSQELAAARSERMVQLAEKERLADRLERLLETLPAAVIVLDGEERIREFNPAAEQLLGRLEELDHWPDVVRHRALTSAVSGNELKLRNGHLLTLSSSRLEQVPGRILVLLDVTETRRLQERLNRRERLAAMGEMSAQLAHQMRTPLSTALLYVSHLAGEDLQPQKRRQFTAKLRNRLQHMERQIHDILMFARGADAGEARLSLSALLKRFAGSIEQELQASQVRLSIDDRSRGRADMIGREDALQGLLANLLENAIQQGASEVRIRLRVTSEIELDVADDGKGIPGELHQRIFDPFFTTRSGGTGLGLAVVQNLVLSHGGEIIVGHSETGGALFHLRFPRALRGAEFNAEISSDPRAATELREATRSLS
ncbi:MAG: PAS domain-containing protein [Candidatus Thiodiazotropha sp. (ex Dulcina madagascariensis)]|nr:PAS domain-containing protein [Candidatus Thiodiazotropha sp. (ex Epidulcina cf. delphinae)]MCU7922598.1 PAS domain-containing protein [Candidatus Thiodiazotropha sp. (ex Dulcina madagascariensis)]MCU7926395.1 PAS domain-containing protein [Candidatus Thiodiazotropha sp. (ex Dulcina madagascariensis)]